MTLRKIAMFGRVLPLVLVVLFVVPVEALAAKMPALEFKATKRWLARWESGSRSAKGT